MRDIGHARVRCCRATDPAQRSAHLCFDLLTPFAVDVLCAVETARCPCGGRMLLLTDTAPEPWEPGGDDPAWETAAREAIAADEAENALPEGEAPDPALPADAPGALREERARRLAAEEGWDRATDMLNTLAAAVRDGAPEARQIARGVMGESDPLLATGVHAPDGRETGIAVSMTTHWATHAMATSFGRSLGQAVNYVEMRLDDLAAPGGRRTYIVTVVRAEGKTAHELRVQAEAQRDALAKAARAYLAAVDAWEREESRWRREYIASHTAQAAVIVAAREAMDAARTVLDAALAGCP